MTDQSVTPRNMAQRFQSHVARLGSIWPIRLGDPDPEDFRAWEWLVEMFSGGAEFEPLHCLHLWSNEPPMAFRVTFPDQSQVFFRSGHDPRKVQAPKDDIWIDLGSHSAATATSIEGLDGTIVARETREEAERALILHAVEKEGGIQPMMFIRLQGCQLTVDWHRPVRPARRFKVTFDLEDSPGLLRALSPSDADHPLRMSDFSSSVVRLLLAHGGEDVRRVALEAVGKVGAPLTGSAVSPETGSLTNR
jgi:hypothetical protein